MYASYPQTGSAWNAKPPAGSIPDWASPGVAGLRFMALLNEGAGTPFDCVDAIEGVVVGSPAWEQSAYGHQVGSFSTSNYLRFTPRAQILHASYPCWVAVLASNTNTVTDGMALCESSTTAAAQYCGIRFNTSGFGGQVSYYIRDNAGTLINVLSGSLAAMSDGTPHVWMGVSFTDRRHRLFLDGAAVGSEVTTVAGTCTYNVRNIGALQRNTVILPFTGKMLWGAMGAGVVPDPAELADGLLNGRYPVMPPVFPTFPAVASDPAFWGMCISTP